MVQIAHSGENSEKINEILLAAQKRFGLYGYSKTTMHEIADDLGISKASLYYYYPDKESLFRAVFEKEKQEFIDKLHKVIDDFDDVELMMQEFINLRMQSFRHFINLRRTGIEEMKGMKNVVKDVWVHFRQKEIDEIKRILTKGIAEGKFMVDDIEETTLIYLDALRGLSHIYMWSFDINHIDNEEFGKYSQKLKEFTRIFIKGISK